jgi:hypothetical protein
MADSNNSPSMQSLPRPSDIPSFMKYAKEKLGIMDAALYITPLQENRLGPDILGDADMEMLTSSRIGIPYGDALRLRKAAPFWWSSHSKRRRDSEDDNDLVGDGQNTDEQHTMLHLRARYPEGGEASYWVPNLLQGDQREHDSYTQYFNDETQEWRPIPEGCTAPKFSGEIVDDSGTIVLMP